MAVGVAVTPGRVGLDGGTTARAYPQVQGIAATSLQVGHVVSAHPVVYGGGGSYGGSFAGPLGSTRAVAGTPAPPMTAAPVGYPAGGVVRRLNSQNSAASIGLGAEVYTSSTARWPVEAAPVAMAMPTTARASVTYQVPNASVVGAAPTTATTVMAAEPMIERVPMTVEDQERVLRHTQLLRQGCTEELLQAELETLRRSAGAQEERITQLTKQLQVSQDNERALTADLELTKNEAFRLSEELQRERLQREQAVAAATELRLAAEMAAATAQETNMAYQSQSAASTRAKTTTRSPSPRSQSARGRESHADSRRSAQGNGVFHQAQATPPQQPAPPTPTGDRRGSGKPFAAKDEIDGRLHEFLERANTGLLFRRLNRGWYGFRRKDDRGPRSDDRSVEISIVNGKLMAKLEPSTHDPGWNNGKLGTVERFCAAMLAAQ